LVRGCAVQSRRPGLRRARPAHRPSDLDRTRPPPARQGVAVLGPASPAAARLENIARFLDFVGENITRAAEQAREVLYTKAAPIQR
jgi:hypothetical protein